ncbi:MAG TPA: CoA transferase [Pseudomonadales bacterium]|nr:CoA transferase [Pseudomonadales bacterium]
MTETTPYTEAAGPLAGVRVLDLTSMISGPVATMMLADQGAEVIKVEPPKGDLVRAMGANRGGVSATFVSANRSKKSVVLDLKTAGGMDALRALARTADVFVQNFRPGAAERMGIGEAAMRAERPDLIYVSISGFGEQGPYAHKRVYDPVIQALSGLASIQADGRTGRPHMIRTIVPDKLTAVTAAQAITAALFARERGAGGQHVKLAMLDAMVAFLWPEGMTGYTFVGREVSSSRAQFAQDLVFATTDGWITAGAVADQEWAGMCRALERPEWLEDERFASAHARIVNVAERLALTAEVLATRSSAEWLERLDAEGVPCAPVLTRAEVIEHDQIVANRLLQEFDHPQGGRIRQPRPAAAFSGTPAGIRGPAPDLGADTDAVLAELGYDAAALAALRAGGALGGQD